MKVRKYIAGDMKEALAKVKQELGPEAVILHSRNVRKKGLRGLFTPRRVEIIAARDERREKPPAGSVFLKKVLEKDQQISVMAKEIDELKSAVSELSVFSAAEEGAQAKTAVVTKKKSVSYWRQYLEHHDLDPHLLEEIISEAEAEATGPGRLSHSRMAEILREKAARKVSCISGATERSQIFIGPTGVGKTTTLAKLAARFALEDNEKVGLITIDHYRIGAVDQLRTYAEIMDLPLCVVLAPGDLFKAMLKLEHCDRILVDTAGRSTGSDGQLSELSAYIDMLLPADVHLVLSATTRRQDVLYIAERFKRLKYNRLIITKIDETNAYGNLLNGYYYTKAPLVYLTDGQKVPEDIKAAGEVDLAGMLWRTG